MNELWNIIMTGASSVEKKISPMKLRISASRPPKRPALRVDHSREPRARSLGPNSSTSVISSSALISAQ